MDYQQMSIFDYIQIMPETDLDHITLEQVRDAIQQATGLMFKPGTILCDERYIESIPKKGIKVSISLSNYAEGINDGRRYVGVEIDAKDRGFGSPCDSITEAIECIKTHLPSYMN